jgi:hypothetical protein
MKLETITFALSDESRGYHVTPERVPLSVLSAFSKEVQDFIKGSGKDIDVSTVDVRIREGSLALESGPIYSESLLADLKILDSGQDLTRVSAKRREIIKKWQGQAKKAKAFAVRITSPWLDRDIVVSSGTDFRETGIARQVNVERYIRGEILDLGGVTDSNAHIRLPNGQKLVVRTDRELIRAEAKNLVYHEVHVRIRAKMDLDTGKLSDPELISFVDYEPKFDAERFEALVKKGREAWRDVGDPAEWVRSIRGDD